MNYAEWGNTMSQINKKLVKFFPEVKKELLAAVKLSTAKENVRASERIRKAMEKKMGMHIPAFACDRICNLLGNITGDPYSPLWFTGLDQSSDDQETDHNIKSTIDKLRGNK